MRSKRSAIAWCFSYIFCLVSAAGLAASNPIPGADEFPPDVPAVVAVQPDDYTSHIDEEQTFLLRLSAPATTGRQTGGFCSNTQLDRSASPLRSSISRRRRSCIRLSISCSKKQNRPRPPSFAR
jgi:hypothetical protein